MLETISSFLIFPLKNKGEKLLLLYNINMAGFLQGHPRQPPTENNPNHHMLRQWRMQTTNMKWKRSDACKCQWDARLCTIVFPSNKYCNDTIPPPPPGRGQGTILPQSPRPLWAKIIQFPSRPPWYYSGLSSTKTRRSSQVPSQPIVWAVPLHWPAQFPRPKCPPRPPLPKLLYQSLPGT